MTTTLHSDRPAALTNRSANHTAEIRVKLSREQRDAAECPARLLRVIAGPGSGKSSVAAYRFGLHRFDSPDDRAVIGLSFTRAAVGVLRGRVADSWGSAALTWPNTVVTVDELHRMTVEHLLGSSALNWWMATEAGLEVIDAWSEEDGAVQAKKDQPCWRAGVVILEDGARLVGAVAHRWPSHGGKVLAYRTQLANHLLNGRCTHDDVRGIVSDALEDPFLRAEITAWAHCAFRAFVVDEAYDSNPLDIEMLRLLTESGAAVTLIGDHWQALYEFRGASPAIFNQTADELGFVEKTIDGSFRFTPELHAIAQDLRHHRGIILTELPNPVQTDVILAPEWAWLWSLGPEVLPLAIGSTPKNVVDAALTLILDALVFQHLHLRASFRRDARRLLGAVHEDAAERQDEALGQILLQIASQQLDFESALLNVATQFSPTAVRKVRALRGHHDAKTTQRYELLADRVRTMCAGDVAKPIAGTTIHQAKGQEWERVAVVVKKAGHKALTDGLDVNKPSDRTLYVGMTRARHNLFLIKLEAKAHRPRTRGPQGGTPSADVGTAVVAWFAVHAAPLDPEPNPVSEPSLFTF